MERNCLNFSNKKTLNAENCVIIAKLISSFLRGCIFGHFGHDYSKSGETERYLTILIALLFQRVQLYNEYAAWPIRRASFELFMFLCLST